MAAMCRPASAPHRRRAALAQLVWGLLAGALGLPGRAAPAVAAADSEWSAPEVVTRILHYTRWPGEPRALTVCITRQGDGAVALLQRLQAPDAGRALTTLTVEADQPLPPACDVVFFDGWSLAGQQAALRRLASRPVLTIGRGAEFCSDGGLFCLESRPGGTRFEVNLDAVARSGLRIHPQVLRLAQPPRSAG